MSDDEWIKNKKGNKNINWHAMYTQSYQMG